MSSPGCSSTASARPRETGVNRGMNAAGSNTIVAPDLASPRFKADPYPFYARLRAEAPVWRTTLPDKRVAWLVIRYDDVARVLKDRKSTRLNSSHANSSYAVFCLKKERSYDT